MDVDFLQRKYFWPSHSLDSLSYFGKTIYTATISNLSSCQTHFMSLARTFTESEHTVVTLAGRDVGKLGTQFKLATCYVHRVRGKLSYHSLPPLRINMPCRAELSIFNYVPRTTSDYMELVSQEYLIFERSWCLSLSWSK